MKLLVTGGAGFIGSNFIRHQLETYPDDRVVNLDKLTYAGNPENLRDIERDPRYRFVHGDVCDPRVVREAMSGVDAVVHLAAESHVDRGNLSADEFLRTNVHGTFTLLAAARELRIGRFVQVGTDEVYGSIATGAAREGDPLNPSNSYAASKAGADLLARAYWVTHRLPVVVTRSSNNFGPYQYPEKVVPLFITNALEDRPLPLYGDGRNVRDWIHVDDHCAALLAILCTKDVEGETFNIGAGNEKSVLEITSLILDRLKKPKELIKHVTDRPGHDRRYALDMSKLEKRTGFSPGVTFERGMTATIDWYVQNRAWWESVRSGEYRQYYERMYGAR